MNTDTLPDGAVTDLKVSPIAAIQSNKLSYVADGAGAQPHTIEKKLGERYSLHDVLSDAEIADSRTGAPTINVTAKVQLALDNNDGKLYVPAGSYLCGTVTTTSAVIVEGDGTGVDPGFRGTRFITPGSGADLFVVDSHNPSTFRDFAIQCSLPTTVGSGITLKCTAPFLGVTNQFSLIDNVRFENPRKVERILAQKIGNGICQSCEG